MDGFLNENNIPFVVRVRGDMTITLAGAKTWSIETLLRRKRARSVPAILQGHLNGSAGPTKQPLRLAAKRLADEWLIVSTNRQEASPRVTL